MLCLYVLASICLCEERVLSNLLSFYIFDIQLLSLLTVGNLRFVSLTLLSLSLSPFRFYHSIQKKALNNGILEQGIVLYMRLLCGLCFSPDLGPLWWFNIVFSSFLIAPFFRFHFIQFYVSWLSFCAAIYSLRSYYITMVLHTYRIHFKV